MTELLRGFKWMEPAVDVVRLGCFVLFVALGVLAARGRAPRGRPADRLRAGRHVPGGRDAGRELAVHELGAGQPRQPPAHRVAGAGGPRRGRARLRGRPARAPAALAGGVRDLAEGEPALAHARRPRSASRGSCSRARRRGAAACWPAARPLPTSGCWARSTRLTTSTTPRRGPRPRRFRPRRSWVCARGSWDWDVEERYADPASVEKRLLFEVPR